MKGSLHEKSTCFLREVTELGIPTRGGGGFRCAKIPGYSQWSNVNFWRTRRNCYAMRTFPNVLFTKLFMLCDAIVLLTC
jgi:hypothetical protein